MDIGQLAKLEFSRLRPQAIIDRAALRANLQWLKQTSSPAGMFMVLKGNAHGHGTLTAAETALDAGITDFAVLLPEEALQVRRLSPQGRVFTWQFCPGAPLQEIIREEVEVGVSTANQLATVAESALAAGKPALVHLKLDSGLSRAGSRWETWPQLVELALSLQSRGVIRLVGFWSHLSNTSKEADQESLQHFLEHTNEFYAPGMTRHIAASVAAVQLPAARLEFTRIGLACFGYCSYTDQLKPVMTLVAPLLKLLPGSNLSDPVRAVIAVGYADGMSLTAAGNANVTLGGWPCRVLEVGPDTSIIEMPVPTPDDAPIAMPPALNEHAVIFGGGAFREADAAQWSKACGTTTDDILCSVKAERVYLG